MNFLSQASTIVAVMALGLAIWVWRLAPRALLNSLVTALSLAVAVWAAGASYVFSTSDEATFWLALRIALSGYIAVAPLGLAVVLTVTDVPWRWRALALALAGGEALAELWANWTGVWIIAGHSPTAWGNTLQYAFDSPWGPIHSRVTEIGFVISLVVLGWRAFTTRSRRYRAIVVQYLILELLTNAVATFCVVIVWSQWGYPDPSVLLAAVYVPFYVYLASRYQHLVAERPDLGARLFQSVRDRVLVARTDGTIVFASGAMLATLGRTADVAQGFSVVGVFPGFPNFEAAWRGFALNGPAPIELKGTWNNQPATINLTPIYDRFRDLDGVLVRLELSEAPPALVQRFGVSSRELEVANLASEGLNTAEIAEALYIAPTTVKNHLANLYRKTGATSRVGLARLLAAD